MNCYPDVLDVLNAAQDVVYGEYMLDKERVDDLEDVCRSIDYFAEKFEAEYVDSEVDEHSLILSISMPVDEMILRDDDMKAFLSLAQRAMNFTMKHKKQQVIVRLDFGGLWVMV